PEPGLPCESADTGRRPGRTTRRRTSASSHRPAENGHPADCWFESAHSPRGWRRIRGPHTRPVERPPRADAWCCLDHTQGPACAVADHAEAWREHPAWKDREYRPAAAGVQGYARRLCSSKRRKLSTAQASTHSLAFALLFVTGRRVSILEWLRRYG